MAERYKILLGVPSDGRLHDSAAEASYLASFNHDVFRTPSFASGPNFNRCWVRALNGGMEGKITHFAMLHTDLQILEQPDKTKRWLDVMVEEMEKLDVSFLSVPIAIKDHRGLTSSGIGDARTRWNPYRRFTTKEIERLPETFTAKMIGYGDTEKYYLLHNHAVALWDMRNPAWYEPDPQTGWARAIFNFQERVFLEEFEAQPVGPNGEPAIPAGKVWKSQQDSEDWAFSRDLWQMGLRTAITRKIKVLHFGGIAFGNWGDGMLFQAGDEDTRGNWGHEEPEQFKALIADGDKVIAAERAKLEAQSKQIEAFPGQVQLTKEEAARLLHIQTDAAATPEARTVKVDAGADQGWEQEENSILATMGAD